MRTTRFYSRPSRFRVHVYDPLIRLLLRRTRWTGFERDALRVLAVRGRRTGRWYQRPVGVCAHEGVRYVVSFYGESGWVRNLRAGADAELRIGRRAESIVATEVVGDAKAELLTWLIRRYPWIGRLWLKVTPSQLTAQDLRRLVDDYPVFAVQPRTA
jgi:deazaflavin-dependent oxidoreductase (nitroreductase family)